MKEDEDIGYIWRY